MGDEKIIAVEGRNHSITKRGEAYPNLYCWIFEMRGNQIVKMIEYYDTALIEHALTR